MLDLHTEADKRYVIFSVIPRRLPDLLQFLGQNSIGYKQLVGSYKGSIEMSFIVALDDFPDIDAEGLVTEQESILSLDKMGREGRKAHLVWLREDRFGVVDYLGIYREVLPSDIHNFSGWTFDPSDRRFYAAGEPYTVEERLNDNMKEIAKQFHV